MAWKIENDRFQRFMVKPHSPRVTGAHYNSTPVVHNTYADIITLLQ